ncbi:hypothetical protein HHI36_017409 [Cryptolaemus montrouzieri]|uniref:Uncharacterized protein n=1 Tax=Cryptolaemus montrouzieri TaxID=559131 RepID=A0ABD2NME7_9CUCU
MTNNQGLDPAQVNYYQVTVPHPYVQGWYSASCTQFDAHQHMNVPQPNLQELILPAATEYNWEGNGVSADIFQSNEYTIPVQYTEYNHNNFFNPAVRIGEEEMFSMNNLSSPSVPSDIQHFNYGNK